MTTRYTQTHERYACTEPVALARFEAIVDPEESAIIRVPDVTIATDRPVRQHVMGLGVVRLRLRLRKRASLAEWQKAGSVQPDGTMAMLGDHGSGDFWSPNAARDNIGRWHNLRIEPKGEGDDAHLAVVADAHIHADLAANWLARGGGAIRPEAVASMFRTGTIRDTSVGFSFNHNTLILEDEERQIYRSDDWTPREASWVWTGADNTGIGRSEDDMSDELRTLTDYLKTLADGQAALVARLEAKPTPVESPSAPAPAVDVATDDKRWSGLRSLAEKELGEDAQFTVELLEHDPERCDKLAAALTAKRAEKRPQPPAVTGGQPNHFNLMRDAQIAMLSQNPTTAPGVADQRHLVADSLITAPLHTFMELHLRHAGLVEPHWTARSPEDTYRKFKALHRPPAAAIRSPSLGGLWLPGEGARLDHNGELDVESSLRSGGAGVAVPADFPALLVALAMKAMDPAYRSHRINIDAWSRRKDMDSLDARNVIRPDVAIPSFTELATAGKDLPGAARFHDELSFKIDPRGFVYSWSEMLMLLDHGGFLVDTPALLGEAWDGERDRFVVNKILDFDYVGAGATFNRNEALTDFLNHVFRSAFQQIIVARPTTIDIKLASRVNNGQLLPTKLIYGPALESEMSDYFKGRLNDMGRLPGDTSDQAALTDWMVNVGRMREMTPFIGSGSRNIYMFVPGGTYSSLIHGNLRGRQGPRMTITDDINWQRWPEIGMRVTEEFGCETWQPNTMYRNLLP